MRNESTRLPRCLESVAGLVDEMVITDTGSTDETVAIAKSAGATVRHFAWCDDFAAAYNDVLSGATGDWILLLDADEQLAPGSHDAVRRMIAEPKAFAYTVLRQDFYGDGSQFTEMRQTRLFRNRPELQFVGCIHQQLEPTLTACCRSESRVIVDSELRIRHDGYLGDYRAKKMDRTIHLLKKELTLRPNQFYYLVELGRALIISGDSSAGYATLGQAASLLSDEPAAASHCTGSIALLLEEVLAGDNLPQSFPLTWDRAEQLAIDKFPDSIPLLWQRARKRFTQSDFSGSVRLLERIQSLADSGQYSRYCSFDPCIIGAELKLNLGVGYANTGRIRQAIETLELIKHDPEHGPAAATNLRALRRLKSKG